MLIVSILVSMGGTTGGGKASTDHYGWKRNKIQSSPFVYVDRTLVPIRFVAENYGRSMG